VNTDATSQTAKPGAANSAAERARASEQRARLLLESARDFAVITMDPERRVDYWSSGAQRLFGYTEEQMIGMSADLIFTPEDRAAGAPEKEAAGALAHGRAEDERWHLRFDGSRLYASGVMSSLRGANGDLLGFVKIARDLTERKLAEERLRAANDDLERRVKARTADLDVANEELRVSNEELRVEMNQRKTADDLRREAIRRIVNVQEEERRRLSRELHDELGQHLAALSLGLSSLDWDAADRPARVKELLEIVEKVSREIHTIAVQLRPTALDDLGLQGALETYVEHWSKRSGVKVDLHATDIAEPRLPPDIELALYRIVQEALTNVLKHAEARVVSVIVERRPSDVSAIIEDDGRGFDASLVAPGIGGRLGLLGMNERAAEFQGVVTVESAPQRGTTVFVRIPLAS
jgi:PAS domain S-box-containing protein